jgi:hypothetical protein
MKKVIILLMAGLTIMPACQNSSKENADQISLQIKLLSQSMSELSSSVRSLQQKQNSPDSKKLPTLSICPKDFPLSAAIPFEFLLMLFDTLFSYPVWLYNFCKDYFMRGG